MLERELARYVKSVYATTPAVKKIFDDARIKPASIKRILGTQVALGQSADR